MKKVMDYIEILKGNWQLQLSVTILRRESGKCLHLETKLKLQEHISFSETFTRVS